MSEHHPDLVADIEAFLAEHDMSEITFGRMALRDPHFMRDIRGKRQLFRSTEKRVRDFMAQYDAPIVSAASSGKTGELSARVSA